MAAPRNLAEALGIKNPLVEEAKAKGRPEPDPVPVGELNGRDLARYVLNSTQYRESILRRILFDELPPAVETKLMDYAWGRPTERVEINDNRSNLENLTTEELEQKALVLATLARQLRNRDAVRMNDVSTDRPSEDEDDRPQSDPSIH